MQDQGKARQGVDVQMALKGFLVLILVIVVTYLAATFVVTTGAMIAARCRTNISG